MLVKMQKSAITSAYINRTLPNLNKVNAPKPKHKRHARVYKAVAFKLFKDGCEISKCIISNDSNFYQKMQQIKLMFEDFDIDICYVGYVTENNLFHAIMEDEWSLYVRFLEAQYRDFVESLFQDSETLFTFEV